jgi:hypothetical protein
MKSITGNMFFIYIKLGCVACVYNNVIAVFYLFSKYLLTIQKMSSTEISASENKSGSRYNGKHVIFRNLTFLIRFSDAGRLKAELYPFVFSENLH